MAWTANDLKNIALQEMNHETITNWNDPLNTDIPIVNGQYELAVPVALVKYAWSFANRYARIDAQPVPTTPNLGTTPGLQKYAYMAELPEDCLGNISVHTSKYMTTLARYEIVGNIVYTDLPEIFVKYTGRVDESVFPPEFVDWFCIFFASRLNSYLNGDMQRQAVLEQSEAFLFRVAKNIDSKRNKHEHLTGNPFLWIRGNMGGGVI